MQFTILKCCQCEVCTKRFSWVRLSIVGFSQQDNLGHKVNLRSLLGRIRLSFMGIEFCCQLVICWHLSDHVQCVGKVPQRKQEHITGSNCIQNVVVQRVQCWAICCSCWGIRMNLLEN